MTDYWLIAYAYRRTGQVEWDFANDPHKGGMSDWFRQTRDNKYAEFALLSAIPISKSQYDWFRNEL